ncbi:MAG: NAD(P)/FAD-dependent oxidoreductase [Acidimicrobiia bacterium]|nr:NAD(P)/FAD-dependent oxidoreductase [Acidimicrobiia bacterium]
MPHTRIAIVGAGFAGLGAAIRLRQEGMHDFVVFEKNSDVGGTWWDNSYPGCRCDVPSHLYSFSFALNPEWSETYSPQPEIWAYLRQTAERFGVLPHIRLSTPVTEARWDPATQRWHLDTGGGLHTADVLIAGNGALSEPSTPDVPGLDRFQGKAFHSARWDVNEEVAGKRVAVIGTGASAIQIVPNIQPDVAQLHVFQRTPPWVPPHSGRKITDVEHRVYRRVPGAQRWVRGFVYWTRELLAYGMTKNPRALKLVRRVAIRHMRDQVKDPELRKKITPQYTPGCKRLLPSNDYYPALTKDNVEVVTEGIAEIREHSVVTADGTEREIDVLVLATGFHVTDNPMMEHIRGTDGRSLLEQWRTSGAQAYLGTTVPNFPNLFVLAGPNTGIGHTSLVFMIEAQIDYVLGALRAMTARKAATVEVRRQPFEAYNAEVQAKMQKTVWNTGGCASWYLDGEGRNTTLWPDYTWKFRRATRRFDAEHYEFGAPVGPVAEPRERVEVGS